MRKICIHFGIDVVLGRDRHIGLIPPQQKDRLLWVSGVMFVEGRKQVRARNLVFDGRPQQPCNPNQNLTITDDIIRVLINMEKLRVVLQLDEVVYIRRNDKTALFELVEQCKQFD